MQRIAGLDRGFQDEGFVVEEEYGGVERLVSEGEGVVGLLRGKVVGEEAGGVAGEGRVEVADVGEE